jgi:hypothetical protein
MFAGVGFGCTATVFDGFLTLVYQWCWGFDQLNQASGNLNGAVPQTLCNPNPSYDEACRTITAAIVNLEGEL